MKVTPRSINTTTQKKILKDHQGTSRNRPFCTGSCASFVVDSNIQSWTQVQTVQPPTGAILVCIHEGLSQTPAGKQRAVGVLYVDLGTRGTSRHTCRRHCRSLASLLPLANATWQSIQRSHGQTHYPVWPPLRRNHFNLGDDFLLKRGSLPFGGFEISRHPPQTTLYLFTGAVLLF